MKILATFLTVILVAPSVFLVAPQKARAATIPTFETNPAIITNTVISAIKSTLSAALDITNTAAGVAQQINTYVLQPLAFVLSGNLLKLITASVIAFVVGKTNGTGAPQFVQNLQGNLQGVGDTKASAFFMQFGRNSNSPFASSINSSLRNNYLQNTSSAGFFAANQNTMARYSPNPNAFMAGNWSQGGVGAWFALTTQDQNNPYTFQQASQRHLASVVGSAESARLAELGWGQGFLSWCGASDTAVDTSNVSCPSGQILSSDTNQCYYASGANAGQFSGATPAAPSASGVAPGAACYNSDGTSGTIKTPGASIKTAFDNAIDSTRQKLVQMGNMGPEITKILGNVATVMGTVNFATQLLGGQGQGGLFSISQTSGTNSTSRLMQYQSSPGYLGVTQGQVYQNAATLPVSGSDMLERVRQYESSWNTLRAVADSAVTSLVELEKFCTDAAKNSDIADRSKKQAEAARSAISSQAGPILSQATTAFANISEARAMVQKIQNEANLNTEGAGNAYGADLLTLQSMPPSVADVVNAEQETRALGQASANGLSVSGGTIVDRMNLLKENANTLKTSVCSQNSPGGSD